MPPQNHVRATDLKELARRPASNLRAEYHHGIKASMSRKVNCFDNAPMERLSGPWPSLGTTVGCRGLVECKEGDEGGSPSAQKACNACWWSQILRRAGRIAQRAWKRAERHLDVWWAAFSTVLGSVRSRRRRVR